MIRKAESVERAIQPIAAAVSGEDPPGAIPSVRGRGQSDNQQSSMGIPESWKRLGPIVPFLESAHLSARHFLPISH